MNPATLERASPGITRSTPRIIEPVTSEAMIPERTIILGMSFCGSLHLLGGAVEELEADEEELQQADDGEEADDLLGWRSATVIVPAGLPSLTRNTTTRMRRSPA